MANSTIAIDEPSTIDKRLDTEQLTVGANTVERERVQVAGATDVAISSVLNANPAGTEYALLVRTLQGFASGTPMFADPIDRALRDMGKIDIAGFDAALPAGANNIGAVNSRVRNAADSAYIEPATLGEQQTQTTALQLIDNIVHAMNAAFGNAAAIAGQFDDTAPTAATEDNIAPVRITSGRALHVSVRDALPAGTNNIGDVDILSFSTGAIVEVQGDVAHDAANAGNPVQVGREAIAHGANPTAVAAADATKLYANRHGIPFVLGGHPNIITIEAAYTAAQTDTAIVTVAAGLKIIVTQIQMTADNANTVDVGFRVGFGATTTPTTTGVVLTHPGVAAGSGISRGDGSGIVGVGADNEDLRITSEVPTTGSIRILVSYFTIES